MGLSLSQIDQEWVANQRVVTVEATFDTNYQNETGEHFNTSTWSDSGRLSILIIPQNV